MSAALSVEALAEGIASGDRATLGRALTLVESERPGDRERAQALLAALMSRTGHARRVGISGPPGVGKSTFIDALGTHLTDAGERVAVLAVDPSSGASGGSILGDKTRMAKLSRDERAFVRPSPSRGALGGVARKTRESILVCEAAGYGVVLVETVGVGQSETAVARMVDCFMVLVQPNAGDELQGIKRGILELADLLVVNKADGPLRAAAERAKRDHEAALHYLRPAREAWRPEVVAVSALEGRGIDALWSRVLAHREALEASGELSRLRADQAVLWMWHAVESELVDRLRASPAVKALLPGLEAEVRAGEVPATAAAEAILRRFGLEV